MTDKVTGERSFILGLGAQKCGTSWLFDYLAASGVVATQKIKEYHIWDALCIPGLDGLVVKPQDSEKSFENRVRFFMQQSPENYFTYFAYMMNEQAKQIACDITPLYSGLKRDVLQTIKWGFAARGIDTRAVFLMRDPVERCWSAARMDSRDDVGHTRVDEDEVVRRSMSRLAELRTRYDHSVAEIEAALAPHETYLGIYEEMFEPERLQQLSTFCHVPVRPAHSARKVNATEVAMPISGAACRAIAAHYRDVYEFAAKRFPQTERLWRGFHYL